MVIDKKSSADMEDRADAELIRMNMLGQLSFGIIHDIRNSLQILRASSMMLRKHTTDEKLTLHIDNIDAVIESSAQMAERVLSFANKSNHLIAEIDLRSPLDEIITLSRYILPPHIHIEYLKPDHSMPMMGNEVELSQALLNLIKNASEAIEATQRKGSIHISVRECPPWIELKVRDNGRGIPPDQIEQVFAPLFTTKEDGTGIGLANVCATVESHGGVISVKSTLGEGSEFTMMLPKKNR